MPATRLRGDAEGALAPGAADLERGGADDEVIELEVRRARPDDLAAQSSTSPRTHVTDAPPTHTVPSSRAMATRPARPSRVPWATR